MTAVRVRKISLKSFVTDRRGASAFEMVVIYPFLLLGVMLPLADLAIAGYRYISAYQALQAFGQSLVYSPPDNLGDTGTWTTEAEGKAADLDFSITNLQLICGDGGAACSSGNIASPKYFSFQTSVTLEPMVLSAVLCSNSCTYTLNYSARFQ
jgi:Flp pilus assembly protein TadG